MNVLSFSIENLEHRCGVEGCGKAATAHYRSELAAGYFCSDHQRTLLDQMTNIRAAEAHGSRKASLQRRTPGR